MKYAQGDPDFRTPDEDVEPTWRTLAEIDDSPPEDLLLGMLEPGGPNLMYAFGGTGKGTTGAWMLGELLKLGLRSAIYDPENRPREWARRVSGLGVDRSEVVYLQPKDLPRTLLGQPLWEIAPYLGRVAKAAGVDVQFVDSILPAVGVGEERLKSDAQVPYLYVAALDAMEVTSVSFGHPPKGQPEGEPFGSVAWVNAMRLTWLGTLAGGEGHRVRWRPRKKNERGHIGGVLLEIEYGTDGRPCLVKREDDEVVTRQWLLDEALDFKDARKVPDMAHQLLDELEEDASIQNVERTQARLRQTLLRLRRDGLVDKDGLGRTATWRLSRPPSRRPKTGEKVSHTPSTVTPTANPGPVTVPSTEGVTVGVTVRAQTSAGSVTEGVTLPDRDTTPRVGVDVSRSGGRQTGAEERLNGGQPTFAERFARMRSAAWSEFDKDGAP